MLVVDHQFHINYEINKKDFTSYIIKSYDAVGDVFIQHSIIKFNQEYIIKGIKENSFKNQHITSVQFADNSEIECIEKGAFHSSIIKYIKIPQKVKMIDSDCFRSCQRLITVEFADNSDLKLVSSYSFAYSSISYLKIPRKVTKIGSFSFSGCKQLKTIEFEENSELETIEDFAFYCSSIEAISIPLKAEHFSQNCFNGTINLKNVFISPMNKKIRFDENNQLILTNSGQLFNEIFFAVRNITRVIIPSSIRVICSNAFNSCTQLQTVEFQENSQLEIIESNAFSGASVTRIAIPESAKQIGESCFCRIKLETIEFSENSMLEVINSGAFSSSEIKSIVIPASVKLVNSACFKSCASLISVDFLKNDKIESFDKFLFKSSSIKNVLIPRNVRVVDNECFEDTYELKTVEFDENSKVESLGERALLFSSIEYMVVHQSVKKINKSCFYICRKLKSMEFLGDMLEFDEYSVSNCDQLHILSFPNAQSIITHKNNFRRLSANISLFVLPQIKIIIK